MACADACGHDILSALSLPNDAVSVIVSMISSVDLMAPHMYESRVVQNEMRMRFERANHPLHSDACIMFFHALDDWFSAANFDLIERSIELGADVNGSDACISCANESSDWSPLHLAVASRDSSIVELLLRHGADANSVRTSNGVHFATPVYRAAALGRDDVIDLLLAHGSDVNIHASNGNSCLDIAAINRRVSTVELLARHGCLPEALDSLESARELANSRRAR